MRPDTFTPAQIPNWYLVTESFQNDADFFFRSIFAPGNPLNLFDESPGFFGLSLCFSNGTRCFFERFLLLSSLLLQLVEEILPSFLSVH
jgi:hypothetical protein